jgi:hypothetical protein
MARDPLGAHLEVIGSGGGVGESSDEQARRRPVAAAAAGGIPVRIGGMRDNKQWLEL